LTPLSLQRGSDEQRLQELHLTRRPPTDSVESVSGDGEPRGSSIVAHGPASLELDSRFSLVEHPIPPRSLAGLLHKHSRGRVQLRPRRMCGAPYSATRFSTAQDVAPRRPIRRRVQLCRALARRGATQARGAARPLCAARRDLGEITTSVLRVGDALIRGDTERLAGILRRDRCDVAASRSDPWGQPI
jgi:hypothetical protein